MKTSEFIKQFNKLDTYYHELDTFFHIRAVQEEVFSHGVEIIKHESGKDETLARLPEDSKDWDFYGGFHFSPEMLELMVELAKTPPEEREDAQRYVILNSELRYHQHWDYFKIGDKNQYLILRSTRDPEVLKMGSYTLEELEKEKRWLPKKWRSEINNMLTPLDVALEEGKGVPKADRTIEVKRG